MLPVLRVAGFTLASLLGLAVLAVVGIWGHFWDFRIGDPTAAACDNCHAMQSYQETAQASDMLVENHVVRGVTCVDCHEQTLETQLHETVAQLTGSYDEPLRRVKYDNDRCFICHEHVDYRQISWRTTDLGVTDGQAGGTTANPHAPPHWVNMDCNLCHLMHHDSRLHCAECHDFDLEVP